MISRQRQPRQRQKKMASGRRVKIELNFFQPHNAATRASKVESGANLALARERASITNHTATENKKKQGRECGRFAAHQFHYITLFPPPLVFSPIKWETLARSGASQVSTYLPKGEGCKKRVWGKKGRGKKLEEPQKGERTSARRANWEKITSSIS